MTNLTSKLLGGVAVAIIASAVSAPAQAQTVLYSGGGTLAEKVYRDIFNCYGGTDGGDFATNLVGGPAGCNAATAYRGSVLQSYVGVGSGNGKKAFRFHDASKLTDGPKAPDAIPVPASATTGALYGTGTGATWVRDTTDSGPFPTQFHFAGSDDPLTAADLVDYFATSGGTDMGHPGNFGQPIQLPAFSAAVSIAFHPTVGWVEKGKKVSGGTSQVNLDVDTWCGIFTGAITNWNDNAFKANNGGQQLGNGQIKVFFRSDGSGTTFLFSNALIHQCGTASTPRSTHPIPDSWLTDNGLNPVAANADALPSSNNNFYLAIAPAHFPAGSSFTGANGNGGMQAAVNANAGGVAYLSPDFALPVDTSGPKTANLQVFDTNPLSPRYLPGALAKFLPPTGKAAAAIMAKVKPPLKTAGSCTTANTGAAGTSPDGVCSHNPINFGVTQPTPVGTAAYPIGGFTFIDLYTCYASASDVDAIAGTTGGSLGLFRWYFGSATDNLSVVKNQLLANAFGTIPGAWLTLAKAILTTDAKTKVTAGNTGLCAGKSGA